MEARFQTEVDENAGDGSASNRCDAHVQNNSRKCFKESTLIYLSHFLSSFGDRVWDFAVAIYLYYMHPCSLLLTAVYGLSTCGSLFLLGAPIGRWVDKSKRLQAARITILIQNASVVVGAAMMASAIYFKQEISPVWNGGLEVSLYLAIIILAIIADLASMANKIVLEKDWIVVLAQGNEQKLSELNATMRTINLSCKVIAPFAVGHILTWFSYVAGAIFIATWNVLSAIGEYYLLHSIFSRVPELSTKGEEKILDNLPLTLTNESHDSSTPLDNHVQIERDIAESERCNNNEAALNCKEGCTTTHEQKISPPTEVVQHDAHQSDHTDPKSNKRKLCSFFYGWKIYFSRHVKFAGLGLASLYMTVLSFDSVTIGYISSQGVSAGVVGNLTAVAAAIGILGSLSFPIIRKRLGKNSAGILGFGMETLCLLMCVASVIAPGSPFTPESIFRPFDTSCRSAKPTGQITRSLKELWETHSNIYLLMGGIVLARYGLWIADLSVTQTFQEQVEESQRGVMGGVQGSLNQLMSLVKFGLTIALPHPDTFGYLIILSWLFVFFGWMLFLIFVYQDTRRRRRVGIGGN